MNNLYLRLSLVIGAGVAVMAHLNARMGVLPGGLSRGKADTGDQPSGAEGMSRGGVLAWLQP